MPTIESTPKFVAAVYDRIERNLARIRDRLKRPLTYAEKILLGHLNDPDNADLRPGESYLQVSPDRVAMQDATAQMALSQFAHAGIPPVKVPTTVHCDHLIRAHLGGEMGERWGQSSDDYSRNVRVIRESIREYCPLLPLTPLENTGAWLASVIRGFTNYHAVPGNMKAPREFYTQIGRLWLRVIRRRSQKARCRWTWERFYRLQSRWLPRPRLVHPYGATGPPRLCSRPSSS